ncbi:pyridoxamine 5'-phosphate oxidase family protein [Ktedonosporobacter rubrisoli]|uniref:Pyridoxamine 5'-phosphate oxidase family protein n=1 Tax=Ktedonosporobacter rubrisoli TaxID=2509675 RepID=A0A4P6JZ39_KTERU|nr:pyridoxamine 5'-phosphate oxidase family protein [Ktedonosporobacter rubrisoli]QBD81009.1 pyridoxamine 5'-phosphate oxidase family protein [Ktedonosporobacter rubrisoli]
MSENSGLVRAILSQLPYITLATATKDGLPWNVPVYAACDEAFNFFWVSAKYARHSQNIRANQRVAIVVYDSTVPSGTGKGVYIEARAYELADEQECSHALACLQKRGWEDPPSVDMVLGATLRGAYKAVPENMWINTEDEHGLDGRVQVDMSEL